MVAILVAHSRLPGCAPNWVFNADVNMGHRFAPARLTASVRPLDLGGSMEPLFIQKTRNTVVDLLAVGSTLITAAAFLYPMISSQEAGLLGMGSMGTKALLVLPGLAFFVAGLAISIRARRAHS